MTKVSPIILTILVLSFCTGESWCQLSCMNEENKPVDWFIGLKYPNSSDFVYLTPNSSQWKTSRSNIMSNKNMIALTLQPSYDPRYFHAYYNNARPSPNLRGSERGHLKGIVNFGQESGYWLIHSVPKFPSKGKYEYCKNQTKFGQSFICVTLSTPNLTSIVDQLLMMQSTVYSSNVPEKFSEDANLMSNLNNLVKNKNIKSKTSNIITFKSQQLSFTHFGKSGLFGKDLYASLIAPSLQTSLLVETWIRKARINSSCENQYKVFDVLSVKLVDTKFNETRDHSKWAVSMSQDRPFVCIGDINRMITQYKRGGGSICVSHGGIWKLFHDLVVDYENCSSLIPGIRRRLEF